MYKSPAVLAVCWGTSLQCHGLAFRWCERLKAQSRKEEIGAKNGASLAIIFC